MSTRIPTAADQINIESLKWLQQQNYEFFPLGEGRKTPRDSGWRTNDYSKVSWSERILAGQNNGVRLFAHQVVMDVDPRNGGLESLEALLWECDLDALPQSFRVLSGRDDGGFHLYLTKPPSVPHRWNLKAYPGIDFKGVGGLVLAPGCVHPVTKGLYHEQNSWHKIAPMPAAMLELIRKPPPKPRTGKGGEITPEELATLLGALDPHDYGKGGAHHDEWLDIAFAAHDGTQGDGEEQWLDWCALDEQYGEEWREVNRARWLSMKAGAYGGRTFRSLLRAVSRAGRKDLVKSIGWGRNNAAEDFGDAGDEDWGL